MNKIKFNIGQKVWHIVKNKLRSIEIVAIKQTGNGTRYQLKNGKWMSEKSIGQSRKDMIDNMYNESKEHYNEAY
jgi:hypothetical protein